MCGIKPCAECAQKQIGKMAKRKAKVTRRRRRVGAISKGEIQNAGMNTLYAVGGALIANIITKTLTPKDAPKEGDMMNYVPSAVPTILGIVGAMSKSPSLRVMGYTAAATGALKLLKVAGVDIPGMAGVRGLGNPFTRIAAPGYQSMAMVDYKQG